MRGIFWLHIFWTNQIYSRINKHIFYHKNSNIQKFITQKNQPLTHIYIHTKHTTMIFRTRKNWTTPKRTCEITATPLIFHPSSDRPGHPLLATPMAFHHTYSASSSIDCCLFGIQRATFRRRFQEHDNPWRKSVSRDRPDCRFGNGGVRWRNIGVDVHYLESIV